MLPSTRRCLGKVSAATPAARQEEAHGDRAQPHWGPGSPAHPRRREPDPPSPDQAVRLLNLVWAEDEESGPYLWTAFTTGARRGEVSALRENRFDFTHQQVRLARNYLVKQGQRIEKAPKGRRGPRPVPRPVDLRAVPRAFPAPPRRGASPRRPGPRRRVRVLPGSGRPLGTR